MAGGWVVSPFSSCLLLLRLWVGGRRTCKKGKAEFVFIELTLFLCWFWGVASDHNSFKLVTFSVGHDSQLSQLTIKFYRIVFVAAQSCTLRQLAVWPPPSNVFAAQLPGPNSHVQKKVPSSLFPSRSKDVYVSSFGVEEGFGAAPGAVFSLLLS